MTENLVFRNENEIRLTSQKFNENVPLFQKVINEFADLQIGTIETRDDLIQAVANPEGFLNARIEQRINSGDAPTFAGFKLKTAAIAQMIDIAEKNQYIEACTKSRLVFHYFERIGTIHKGKIQTDAKLMDDWIKQNTLIAVTDKQKAVLFAMRKIVEAIAELTAINVISQNSIDNNRITDFVRIVGNNEFAVNHEKFQMFAR